MSIYCISHLSCFLAYDLQIWAAAFFIIDIYGKIMKQQCKRLELILYVPLSSYAMARYNFSITYLSNTYVIFIYDLKNISILNLNGPDWSKSALFIFLQFEHYNIFYYNLFLLAHEGNKCKQRKSNYLSSFCMNRYC